MALEHRVKKLEDGAGLRKGCVFFLLNETPADYERRTGWPIPKDALVFEMTTEQDASL